MGVRRNVSSLNFFGSTSTKLISLILNSIQLKNLKFEFNYYFFKYLNLELNLTKFELIKKLIINYI